MWGHYCLLKPSCLLLQNQINNNFLKTFRHKSHLCVTQQSNLLPCLLLWGVLSTDGVITASWGKNPQLELDRCCEQQLFGLFFSLWPPGATMILDWLTNFEKWHKGEIHAVLEEVFSSSIFQFDIMKKLKTVWFQTGLQYCKQDQVTGRVRPSYGL